MKEVTWINCPVCHGKTRLKVRKDTMITHLPLYCPKCKQENLVNIQDGKITLIKEPDAKTQSR